MNNPSKQEVIANYEKLIPLTRCEAQTIAEHEEMMLCWGLLKQAEKMDGLGSFCCDGCIMENKSKKEEKNEQVC